MHVRNRPDWMTKGDYEILQALDDATICDVLNPAILGWNLDYSRSYVSSRLKELAERGWVERVDEGRYRISERGQRAFAGDMPPGAIGRR